ncbi:DUF4129 domain-containing protein [Streptomyces millisiae]|uniref:DUF4129 domain-containing protein n=1 Tax=Streptomyces millisiae TaxID=3075542 RepID=A0ABU2M068_9ACTN|nr:DUF4129 domain-containing protein [Streptomyces sp. DSM 44918]MDT0323228.1 DUF4129 domain-containing protein [Streptomyces sp. DSM 44918]
MPTPLTALARPAADDDTAPPVVTDREEALREARRELSKPAYAEHEPSLPRRIWNWIWDELLGRLDDVALNTPGGWVGLLVIALLVVALLVALRMRLGALRDAAGPRSTGGLFGDQPRTAAEHRAAADAHAAAGRWPEAVQERLRAIVRALEERALLEPRPGRTATEAAAEAARPLPTLAADLRVAATTFDGITYGGRPAGPADDARMRDLDQRLAATRPDLTATGTGTAR